MGKWRLGDWLSDTNLVRESDAIAVSQPETFLYTSQHFVGLLTISMFMGIEGRHGMSFTLHRLTNMQDGDATFPRGQSPAS